MRIKSISLSWFLGSPERVAIELSGGSQVLLLTHDRDWYTELRYMLDKRRWGFRMLLLLNRLT